MIQPMGNRALVKRLPKGQAQSALIEVVELEETVCGCGSTPACRGRL